MNRESRGVPEGSIVARHTRESLARDLAELGVAKGDTLFVHSSFKSLGPLQGGAAAMVGALEDALGADGLLLVPSFNLKEKGNEARARMWDPATTPTTVGWIAETVRTMPGTVRSDHFSHSVAARGRRAGAFVADHRAMEGMESPWDLAPWGRAYGSRSPFLRAYEDPRGRVLMLGVDYHSSTFCHVAEVMDWTRRKAIDAMAVYCWIDRGRFGVHWDSLGRMRRGRVGDADCRLFGIRDFVDTLCQAVASDPAQWFKG